MHFGTLPQFGAPQAGLAAPQFTPPAIPVPAPVPPLAAPKGKLEAMVPILLVVNTFLLVVVLVVVVFALKGR
jgi:hypothetical protein